MILFLYWIVGFILREITVLRPDSVCVTGCGWWCRPWFGLPPDSGPPYCLPKQVIQTWGGSVLERAGGSRRDTVFWPWNLTVKMAVGITDTVMLVFLRKWTSNKECYFKRLCAYRTVWRPQRWTGDNRCPPVFVLQNLSNTNAGGNCLEATTVSGQMWNVIPFFFVFSAVRHHLIQRVSLL